jgi:transcriptional regulator with XRE-family HTH domain
MNLKQRIELAMRDAPDVTQADLARACHVKPSSVADWLNGKTKNLQADSCLLAAQRLGVRPEWLAGLGGQMHGPQSQPARLEVDRLAELLAAVDGGVPKKIPAAARNRMVARLTASVYEQGLAASTVQSLVAGLITSMEEV